MSGQPFPSEDAPEDLANEPGPLQPPVAALFEHFLEGMPQFLRPGQVAAITGWSRRTIYELCETDETTKEPKLLEAHMLPGRDVSRKQITRRSVAALLLRTGKYDPRDFPALLRVILPTLPPPLLQQLADAVETEIQKQTKL